MIIHIKHVHIKGRCYDPEIDKYIVYRPGLSTLLYFAVILPPEKSRSALLPEACIACIWIGPTMCKAA